MMPFQTPMRPRVVCNDHENEHEKQAGRALGSADCAETSFPGYNTAVLATGIASKYTKIRPSHQAQVRPRRWHLRPRKARPLTSLYHQPVASMRLACLPTPYFFAAAAAELESAPIKKYSSRPPVSDSCTAWPTPQWRIGWPAEPWYVAPAIVSRTARPRLPWLGWSCTRTLCRRAWPAGEDAAAVSPCLPQCWPGRMGERGPEGRDPAPLPQLSGAGW